MFGAGHFNTPLVFGAAIVFHHHLDEDVGIGPAEVLDGALDRNQLRLVEHRKRMVGKRRTCRQRCRDGDEGILQHPAHLFLHRSENQCVPLSGSTGHFAGNKRHARRDYTREAPIANAQPRGTGELAFLGAQHVVPRTNIWQPCRPPADRTVLASPSMSTIRHRTETSTLRGGQLCAFDGWRARFWQLGRWARLPLALAARLMPRKLRLMPSRTPATMAA